ncbi:bifunctional serine/threonine protein kinase/MFS transporter [Streptomyces sp. NBC_01294]|uniref:bifunctional serine/threonine protein kinase/MFS transporter n=1 Tax=Streptomyces sp. NBC_01294 TaxID=2903815 RepID=UPI002DD90EF9|nr:bifunctional serine/threonine protein kinase/MFS transporter [Streptomyces sp. NBC_01294]
MDQLIAEDPPRIGPYRLIARLGAGGMGLVYLGRSEGGRTVAVKVVQAEYAGNPDFRKRFAREVAAARRVDGSWTAAVLDADPEAAVPWVATRYIPGPDLHAVVAKDFGPLPEHSVHTLANRLALALQAVHEAGLIHRDLKPSNVLVTVDGPRVIDFGIARAMDSLAGDSMHTRTGMLIGSAGFMSPEQVRGLELTPASDVFCLGAVLVYAATGRLLFGAGDTGLNAHLFRVAEEEPDLTGVPEILLDLVRACLDKDPAKRPTPRQVAAFTAKDQAAEWLPGAVLAQLGRHAARLLDYAPENPTETPTETEASTGTPAAQPDPRSPSAGPRPLLPPPGYAPTAPAAHFGPAQGFGPPPAPLPGAWSAARPPAPGLQDAEPAHPRRWWGLAVIALAQLMVLLDATAFTLAVPFAQQDLGLPAGDMTLIFNAYLLTFGGLLLLGGHLADLLGRRTALIIGLVGCAAASAIGGSAANPTMLVCARVLQGVFAALLTPSALALVATGFPDPRERGKAFAIYGAIAAGGPALGMATGGWLLESAAWRWCMYAGLPLAVIALIGALTLLHDRPGRTGARLDLPAVLFGTGGSLALTYGLGEVGQHGWTPRDLGLITVGVLLLGAFLWGQTRASSSFLSPSFVKDRNRIGCVLALFLVGVGTVTSLPSVDFYAQSVLDLSPATAGAAFLPMAAAAVVCAQVSGRLLHLVPPRVLIVPGLLLAALGHLLLSFLEVGGAYTTHVLPGMLLIGSGIGLAFTPLFATATAAAAPQLSGGTSATVTAGQELGGAVGGALLGAVIAARVGEGYLPSESITDDLLGGYTDTLWWTVGATLLAALSAGLMITAGAARRDVPAVPTPAR